MVVVSLPVVVLLLLDDDFDFTFPPDLVLVLFDEFSNFLFLLDDFFSDFVLLETSLSLEIFSDEQDSAEWLALFALRLQPKKWIQKYKK